MRQDPRWKRTGGGVAGLLYLIVGVFGAFAIGYVNPLVYAPGDALTTAANVSANAGFVRASVLADLIQATVFVFLAMVLFAILKDVNRSVARAMVILVAIATAVMCLNEVFQIGALLVSGEGPTRPRSAAPVPMRSLCSFWTSTTTASSSPRSSSAYG